MSEIPRSQFVGMGELRANLSKLLDVLEEEDQELVITRGGKPLAVIVDLNKSLEIEQALREFSDPEFVERLFESRSEIRTGRGIVAEEVFEQKHL